MLKIPRAVILGFSFGNALRSALGYKLPSNTPIQCFTRGCLKTGDPSEALRTNLPGAMDVPKVFSMQGSKFDDEHQTLLPTDISGDEHTPHCLALSSYLHCYAPLFQTPDISNGNIDMLFRGCNAHKRLISPLEIETNRGALPGADAVMFMAQSGITFLRHLLDERVPLDESTSETVYDADNSSTYASELMRSELFKMHRALQYAVAGGMQEKFLNQNALHVMLELYLDIGLDIFQMRKILGEIGSYYKDSMPKELYNKYFEPAFKHLLSEFGRAEECSSVSRDTPLSSLEFEPEPDPRTLTPLNVDLISLKDKLPGVAAYLARS